MRRPNILLVVADQLAADCIAALGHPAVRTPHLDALVADAMSYEAAYSAAPLCAPSRAGLMTGRMPSRDGVLDNGSDLASSVPTFAHHLNRAGYTTVLAGKMHFVGPDQHHGFTERLTPDIMPTTFALTPAWSDSPVPNPGTSVDRLRQAPVAAWSLQRGYDDEALHRSLARLRQLSTQDDPWLLCASFAQPHDPFVVTAEEWAAYDDVLIPPPAVAGPDDDLHPFDRWIQVHHEADVRPLTAEETLRARRAYYACVSWVDAAVGTLVAEVGRLGLSDDTIVVFTSDHGEMLGEHGMWFKRTWREGSLRVPLVVRVPRGLTGRRTAPVSLLDLTASLLGWAGVSDAEGLDGVPLGADRGPVRFEYLGEGTIEPLVGVRDGRWKYCAVRGHRSILVDLEDDPHETVNLSGRPGFAELEARLHAVALHGRDLDGLGDEVRASQRRRLQVHDGTPPERTWPVEPAASVRAPYRPRAT